MKRVSFFKDLFAAPRRRRLNRQVRNVIRRGTLETLERRQVLTGNVTATISGGSLFVTGDDAANSVELVQSGSNLVLRGLISTTVNGATSEFVVRTGASRVQESLYVFMNGGNDTFSMGDGVSVRRDAFVYLGEGDDSFAMQGATAHRTLSVDMGNGNDSISLLHSVVSRDVSIFGGLGDKTVSISDSYLGRGLTVVTSSGNDAVLIDASDIHGVTTLATGVGNDDVLIGDSQFHKTTVVDTSVGDDVVRMNPGSSFSDPAVVLLGDGNDNLLADGGNDFNDVTYFVGMTGSDSIDTSGDNSFSNGSPAVDPDQSTVDETALNTRLNGTNGALTRAAAVQAALEGLVTLPTLTVTNSANTIAENATTTLTGTVTRPTASYGEVEVTLTSSDTTELTVPATVTIPAGKTSATFTITPANDTDLDGTQSVTISAKATGYKLGTSPAISVTDDETPSLTLSFATSTINEASPGNVATATVSRPSGSTTGDLTVTIANGDNTQATAPTTVTIADGKTSATFDVTAVDDTTVDGSKTVSFTVSATGFNTDTDSVTVTDNDATESLTLSFNPTAFGEAAGTKASVGTVTRSGATTADLVVTLSSGDTSEATVPATVTISKGQTSATFDVAAINDSDVDGAKSVAIIASATGFSSDSENVTVNDDDVATVLSVSIDPSSFGEVDGAAAATGTVSRTGSTTGALTVTLSSSDTSEVTVDSTVTIPAGKSSVTFPLNAIDDSAVDGAQVVEITASATGHTSGSDTVTVTDDDGESLQLSINPASVSETAGTTAATGTISRSTDPTSALIVTLSSSDTSAATVQATVTIPAGETAVTFPIAAVNDSIANGSQTTTITATASGIVLAATADLTVTDDDVAALTLVLNPEAVSEGAGAESVTGTVSRNTATTDALVVNLASNLTSAATVGATVTIPAGQSSATFKIAVIDNNEQNATQSVTISATATGLTADDAVLSVTDNDTTGTLTFTLAASSAGEGNTNSATIDRGSASTAAALTVSLASSDTSEVTVPQTVTIEAGKSSVTFDVTVVDDTIADGTQTVTLTASATNFASKTATLDVTDNDGPAALSVTLANSSIEETAGSKATTATVRRNTATTDALFVSLESDLPSNVTVPSSVTIPAGQDSVTFDVSAINDDIVSGQRTVVITATAASHADGEVSLQLTDDDVPTLGVTITPEQIAEDDGTGAALATVTRPSGSVGSALTVTLQSSNPSKATVPATVTIAADQTSATFEIDAVDNSIADGAATVTITVSASNFNSDSATVEVADDDGPATLTVAITDSTTSETNAAGLTATVTRNTDTSSDLVVTISSSDTSELQTPSTVTIPAGSSSQSFTVTVRDDDFSDSTQSVSVTPVTNGFLGVGDSVDVTDNEPAAELALTITPETRTETFSEVAYNARVTRNTDPSVPLIVTLSRTGTGDISLPASVTIGVNQLFADFTMSLADDDVFTGTRTIDVTATAGELNDTVTLTINEDDSPQLTVSLDPSSISETAGKGAVTGTVTRPVGSEANDAVVSLTVSDTSEATAPTTVTIPAGKTSATFAIDAVDDSVADGSQSVTVTASATLFVDGKATLTVTDNELGLTLDTPTTGVTDVGGDLITKTELLNLTGSSAPQATIELDADNDGSFDDGSDTADANGDFSIGIDLVPGSNTLRVRSTSVGNPTGETRQLVLYYAVGSVIQFQSTQGDFAVELLDADAPNTVANFKSYMASYTNSIAHALVPDTIVQGGGYTVANSGAISAITENAPIDSEFKSENSNIRGTLSMAVFAGDPDSGTSQWFFNLDDANAAFDSDGNTVFGRVIGNGLDVLDTINALQIINLTVQTGQTELASVPIVSNLAFTAITGTVSVSEGSSLVTGTGTAFLSELAGSDGDAPGSTIRINGETHRVQQVITDELLLLEADAAADATDVAIERHVAPDKAAYVVFSNIGEILNGGI